MTEEIITDLSRVNELLVISRSSAMTFKGTKKMIPEIARAVNVRYILEGSVRKAGKDLRITAQLIQADNDRHLWAERYDGVLEDDTFAIYERIAASTSTPADLERATNCQKRVHSKATPEEKKVLDEVGRLLPYESKTKKGEYGPNKVGLCHIWATVLPTFIVKPAFIIGRRTTRCKSSLS